MALGIAIGILLGLGLGALLWLRRHPTPTIGKSAITRVEFDDGSTVKGEITLIMIRAGKSCVATATYKDQFGNPASIQSGSGVGSVDDDTKASIEVLPEEPDAAGNVMQTKIRIRSLGPAGAVEVTIKGDGDPGATEQPVEAKGALLIVAGNATVSEITFGAEED